MAVKGYFYNSVNRDRLYNGQDMNEDKAPFYKEGVVYGHLGVTAGNGMTVRVDGGSRTGYAYINLHTIHNTTVMELQVSQASGNLSRIDRVILRNDESERKPSILILEGAFSSSPQPPKLTNTDAIQEKCLAEIYVAAGAVEITQADITDTRADTSLCGFIASQFQELNFEQLAAQFNSWFLQKRAAIEKSHDDFVDNYEGLLKSFMDEQQIKWTDWNTWYTQEKEVVEKDHAEFIVKYENLTQSFMDIQQTEWEEWFSAIQGILAKTENGELLEEVRRLYEELYDKATESDIDKIISGQYLDVEENSIFETATNEDIDSIIEGSYIQNEDELH